MSEIDLMHRVDLDLMPQSLPEGWIPGVGLHLGGMIVGEAPGRREWEQKTPFVGASGQLLRSELKGAGLHLEDMYITNIVKIWPRNDNGQTRPPVPQEIDAALPYLVEEIQHVVPKYILALGNIPYQTLTGADSKISLYRGIWTRLDEVFDWGDALVLPTYHPAYIMRNPKIVDVWRRDLNEFASAWLRGPE